MHSKDFVTRDPSLAPTTSLQAGAITPAISPPPGPVIGAIGRFQLLAQLGSGGFGTVYRAFDPQLQREVAIKVPRNSARLSEFQGYQFLHEGRAAARLEHPNLVQVFDAGREGNVYYIVSAYVRGTSLREQMRSPQLSQPVAAARLIRQIAAALDAAHAKGIFHRDIKPENILLDEGGKPLVADFGLARVQQATETGASDEAVLGTPAYMSPEQAAGKSHQADARSDLWSLGVVLYELLAGTRPFPGSGRELRTAIIELPPRPLRDLKPAIPADLAAICEKCLAKDPAKRYATCTHLREDLDRFLRGDIVTARKVNWPEWTWRRARQNPVIAGSLATIAIVIAVSGVLLWNKNIALASALTNEKQAKKQAQSSEQTAQQHLRRSVQTTSQYRQVAFQKSLAEGDPHLAVLPLLEDLQEPQLEKLRQQMHRVRLGITLRYAPRLRQSWDGVLNCLVSPTGQHVVVSKSEGVSLFQTSDGKVVATLPRLTERASELKDAYTPLAFSVEGRHFAFADGDTVQIFRAADGQPVGEKLNHAGRVAAVAFSHDHSKLATLTRLEGKTFQARVWSVTTGKPASNSWEVTLPNPPAEPLLLFDAANQLLMIGGYGNVSSWDPGTGKSRQQSIGTEPLRGMSDYVSADGRTFRGLQLTAFSNRLREGLPHDNAKGEFSRDGRWIAATFDAERVFEIWNVSSGTKQFSIPSPFIMSHTQSHFTAGNRWLLATGLEDFALLLDLHRQQPIARLRMPHQETDHVQSSRNGRWLLTWTPYRRSARLWEMSTPFRSRLRGFPEIAGQTPAQHPIVTLHLGSGRAAGRHAPAAVFGQPAGATVDGLWDLVTYEPVGEQGTGGNFAARSPFSAPVSATANGFRVIDLQQGKFAGPLITHINAMGVAASLDRRWLVTCVMSDPALGPKDPAFQSPDMILWDAATGQEKQRFEVVKELQGTARFAAFTPDGKRLILGTGRRANEPRGLGRLAIWNVESGKLLYKPLEFPTIAMIRNASPDGRRFAIVDGENRLSIVDVEAGKVVAGPATLADLSGWIRFSPNGDRLVVCGRSQAKVISAEDCRDLTLPFGSDCRDAKFSPSGALVAVGSLRSVQLFDALTGETVSGNFEHDDFVTDFDFTKDSRTLVTATSCGDLFYWNLQPDERDLAVLALEGELITGRRLGENNQRLSPTEQIERWEEYRSRQNYLPLAHFEAPPPLIESRPVSSTSPSLVSPVPASNSPTQPTAIADLQGKDVPGLRFPRRKDVLLGGTPDAKTPYTWDFDWDDVPGAEMYEIVVQTPSARLPAIQIMVKKSEYRYSRTNAYAAGANIWGWKIRSRIDGKWGEWSEVQLFQVRPSAPERSKATPPFTGPASPVPSSPSPPRSVQMYQLTPEENKSLIEQIRLKEITVKVPVRAGGAIVVNCPYENCGKEIVFPATEKPVVPLIFSLGLESLDLKSPPKEDGKYRGAVMTNHSGKLAARLPAGTSDENPQILNAASFPAGKYKLWVYLELTTGKVIDSQALEIELEPALR